MVLLNKYESLIADADVRLKGLDLNPSAFPDSPLNRCLRVVLANTIMETYMAANGGSLPGELFIAAWEYRERGLAAFGSMRRTE